jgi:hypothetical protein
MDDAQIDALQRVYFVNQSTESELLHQNVRRQVRTADRMCCCVCNRSANHAICDVRANACRVVGKWNDMFHRRVLLKVGLRVIRALLVPTIELIVIDFRLGRRSLQSSRAEDKSRRNSCCSLHMGIMGPQSESYFNVCTHTTEWKTH